MSAKILAALFSLATISAVTGRCGAFAADQNNGDDKISIASAEAVLSMMGCKEELATGTTATLTITCDQEKVIAAMPSLKQMGIINPDLTETAMNVLPLSLTGVVLTETYAAAIPAIYSEKTAINSLRVIGAITSADTYGNVASHVAMSFGFDRSLYQRINWEHFDVRNIMKVARGPATLSQWYRSSTAAEAMSAAAAGLSLGSATEK
jgi:hypothetical protein